MNQILRGFTESIHLNRKTLTPLILSKKKEKSSSIQYWMLMLMVKAKHEK